MKFIVILFAILKNVIYGSSVFFTGHLAETVNVADILALRFLISFSVLYLLKITGIVKIEIGIKDIFHKNERTLYIKSIIAAGFFEAVLDIMFETIGISMTSGITTAVILALAPIMNCITEIIVLKEKTSFSEKILLVIGIAGVVYIAVKSGTGGGRDSFAGILFLFAAVFCGALYCAFSRKSSKRFTAMEITYVFCAIGALAFNLFNIIRHIYMKNIFAYFTPLSDFGNLTGFVFLAVISTIIATAMNNFALGRMQITTMAAFGGVSTLTTILIGVVVKKETLYYYHYIGLTLIFIRMVGVNYIASKRKDLRI